MRKIFKFQISVICQKEFIASDIKVRDHCHIKGHYRGATHQKCNIQYRLTDKIPIFFHNLEGYHSHFIMQETSKFQKEINVIAKNSERYISFMIDKLICLDSMHFMNTRLENLVNNLPKYCFKYTDEYFSDKSELMKKKGVYPYDYMDSFDKFKVDHLPKQSEFYSLLTDTNISNNKYQHAQNIWNEFKLENMAQCHDLYLKSDILLLSDVFENIRKTCLNTIN